MFVKSVLELLDYMENNDDNLYRHCLQVGSLSHNIASYLTLPEMNIIFIISGALLHDLGKMEMPAGLLEKQETLSKDEWRIMRQHPWYSMKSIAYHPDLLITWPIIVYHHERWDGNGYYKLKGREIPLGARIVALADAVMAMTTKQSYREAMSYDDMITEVKQESALQFDPHLAKILTKVPSGEIFDLGNLNEFFTYIKTNADQLNLICKSYKHGLSSLSEFDQEGCCIVNE